MAGSAEKYLSDELCRKIEEKLNNGHQPCYVGQGRIEQDEIRRHLLNGRRQRRVLVQVSDVAVGRSTRLLVGVWQPARGKVRLDGCTFDQWSSEVLGAHIGYLPQDVELLGGTVAQNIARFEPKADPQAIVAAAKAAGVHELIIELGEGYETQVGERGETLSAGQAQRIALARALYRDPFLIVLDEPNSNLDAAGDEALTRA